ncbi:MAG: Rrf2 family transcriptional regulator [Hyphomicrobium sp.]|jgi:Rrf2 family nitric oxide-sensitive transcriptional repressor|nr:Rrf2 family transcriptional regulator [Hyphomicrobium sp.]
MQLTKFTDYSLRALVVAALRDPDLVTISELASLYDISEDHVRKVMHQLTCEDFLESVRGRSGGFRLARPAELITIGQVVRSTEPELRIVECFKPSSGQCRIEPCCELKPIVREALAAFLGVLDRYTVADLIRRDRRIAALLGLDVLDRVRS